MTFQKTVARNLQLKPAAVRAMLARARKLSDKMSPKPGDELAVDEHAARRIRESIGRAVVANPLPLACRKTPPQAQHVTTRPPAPRRRDYERGGRLDAYQRMTARGES